jgi:carboxypeptidase C (cathepsin A)
MNSLQDEILASGEMKKYPDLQIIADFFKQMKRDTAKDKQTSKLSLQAQFDAIISKLNGKVATKLIVYFKQIFSKNSEDLQEEMQTLESDANKENIKVTAIMQVLAEQLQTKNLSLTQDELVLGGKYYLEHNEFPSNVMTLLQMDGIDKGKLNALVD